MSSPPRFRGWTSPNCFPRHAAIADKFTILRSMRSGAGAHPAGSMQLLSGDPDTRDKPSPKYPDWMSVTNYLRSQQGGRTSPLPSYVGINPPLEYNGPAYLGDAYSPFTVHGDPNDPKFSVPNIGLTDGGQVRRLGRRSKLRENLDTLERSFDKAGELAALDEFESRAMSLLVNPKTKEAFDLSREDDRTRDRYGRNTWGAQLLLARRLVEAGVEVLTTTLKGPLCGRVQNWDDHAVNHHVFQGMKFRADAYDQAVTALIEDIHERGLDKRVLVVVTGEFGRTPKINYAASTGAGDASAPAGTMQPGATTGRVRSRTCGPEAGSTPGGSLAGPTSAARTRRTAFAVRGTSWRRFTTTWASTQPIRSSRTSTAARRRSSTEAAPSPS